jgi:hypothetical protein
MKFAVGVVGLWAAIVMLDGAARPALIATPATRGATTCRTCQWPPEWPEEEEPEFGWPGEPEEPWAPGEPDPGIPDEPEGEEDSPFDWPGGPEESPYDPPPPDGWEDEPGREPDGLELVLARQIFHRPGFASLSTTSVGLRA